MEFLKLVLPSEVVSKVRLYHSHPVADMLHPWILKFKWGNAFDNDLPELLGFRKHFHLVVLDTLKHQQWERRPCSECGDPNWKCECPSGCEEELCDCCCELWDHCQCMCHNCGDEYSVCRYNCFVVERCRFQRLRQEEEWEEELRAEVII